MIAICVAATLAAPVFKLVFADEFNSGSKPNAAHWIYENGFVRNRELQWYQEANARIENGLLILEARRERVKNPYFDPALPKDPDGPASKPKDEWKRNREFADYTSAGIKTMGKHAWTFGRFEMRARFDPSIGLWPAFWAVGSKGKWPSNGEIDIFEFYRATVLANAAWGEGTGIWDDAKIPLTKWTTSDPNWTENFHVWRMDWDSKWIRIYLDDEMLNEIDLSKTVNADGVNPFHGPHHLILNLAVGSTGGDPSQTEFPKRFEVDFVRVYQPIPPK